MSCGKLTPVPQPDHTIVATSEVSNSHTACKARTTSSGVALPLPNLRQAFTKFVFVSCATGLALINSSKLLVVASISRSEDLPVGKECVRTCRSRGSRYNKKKKK